MVDEKKQGKKHAGDLKFQVCNKQKKWIAKRSYYIMNV
jgi:hypothetical protein